MELERLELELRPRGAWQAVDLGFPLLRRHARSVYPAWLILWSLAMLPAVALVLVFPQWQGLGSFLPWFLRPLLERLPLHMLSRGVFGEDLTVRAALAAWPRLCRDRWFSSLTWGRLVPARALVRCVHQLEAPDPSVSSLRSRQVRGQGTGTVAGLWLLCCAHFEMLLILLPTLVLGLFLPSESVANPFALLIEGEDLTRGLQLVFLSGYWLAGALVAPAFVSGSFTLYLERRSSLEAWDLEIALRRMVRRHLPGTRLVLPVLLVLAGAASAGTCKPPDWSEPVVRSSARDQEQRRFRAGLDSLLADSAFQDWRCREIWVPRDLKAPKDQARPEWLEAFVRWLGGFGESIGKGLAWSAQGLRLGLILLLVCAVLWLIWRFRGSLPRTLIHGSAPEPLQGRSLALERSEDLDALERGCEEALQAGDLILVLGILYRSCLLESGLGLARGRCERQCLRAAREAVAGRRLSPSMLELLESVVRHREQVRWAGGAPSSEVVQGLVGRWKALRREEDRCVPA